MKFEYPAVGVNFTYETIRFDMPSFKRSIELPGYGMGLIATTTSTVDQTPIYNGFIGIAPY